MSYVDPPKAEEVKDAKTFAAWAQATLGCPHANLSDMKMLQKKAKDLFATEPGTDWQTLVKVGLWCRSKKRRLARVGFVVDQFRWAYAAGAVNTQQLVDDDLEKQMAAALAKETDPNWTARLRRTAPSAQRAVLREWREARGAALSIHD